MPAPDDASSRRRIQELDRTDRRSKAPVGRRAKILEVARSSAEQLLRLLKKRPMPTGAVLQIRCES